MSKRSQHGTLTPTTPEHLDFPTESPAVPPTPEPEPGPVTAITPDTLPAVPWSCRQVGSDPNSSSLIAVVRLAAEPHGLRPVSVAGQAELATRLRADAARRLRDLPEFGHHATVERELAAAEEEVRALDRQQADVTKQKQELAANPGSDLVNRLADLDRREAELRQTAAARKEQLEAARQHFAGVRQQAERAVTTVVTEARSALYADLQAQEERLKEEMALALSPLLTRWRFLTAMKTGIATPSERLRAHPGELLALADDLPPPATVTGPNGNGKPN